MVYPMGNSVEKIPMVYLMALAIVYPIPIGNAMSNFSYRNAMASAMGYSMGYPTEKTTWCSPWTSVVASHHGTPRGVFRVLFHDIMAYPMGNYIGKTPRHVHHRVPCGTPDGVSHGVSCGQFATWRIT